MLIRLSGVRSWSNCVLCAADCDLKCPKEFKRTVLYAVELLSSLQCIQLKMMSRDLIVRMANQMCLHYAVCFHWIAFHVMKQKAAPSLGFSWKLVNNPPTFALLALVSVDVQIQRSAPSSAAFQLKFWITFFLTPGGGASTRKFGRMSHQLIKQIFKPMI